jgi:hypothetical protein
MQTSIKVCIWRTFWFSYAKYAQDKYADLIHTLCRLVKTFADLVQTIIQHIQVFT